MLAAYSSTSLYFVHTLYISAQFACTMYTFDKVYVFSYSTDIEGGVIIMDVLSATDVRKNWSMTLDSVIHVRPAYVKRTRDNLAIINIETLNEVLSAYAFKVKKYVEKDGSVTLSSDNLDLAVNGPDESRARQAMAADIKEYAEDYYENFSTWSISKNRKAHIPYVLKALSMNEDTIAEEIICQNGKI